MKICLSDNLSYVKYFSIPIIIFNLFAATQSIATPVALAGVIDPKTAGVLEFIGALEAPGGYNTYSYYAAAPPPKQLTRMTIGEVLAWQDHIDARSKSEAAGRYQIMEDTLRGLVRKHNVDTRVKFNGPTQDRLAMLLLKRRGWDVNSSDYINMANRLALEWAALPLVSGPNRGQSAYRNTKGAKNRAQTSPEIFLKVLSGGAVPKMISGAVKLSRTHRRIARIENSAVVVQRISSVKTIPTSKVKGGAITPSKVIVFKTDPFQLD